jgi:hypothetical protein
MVPRRIQGMNSILALAVAAYNFLLLLTATGGDE